MVLLYLEPHSADLHLCFYVCANQISLRTCVLIVPACVNTAPAGVSVCVSVCVDWRKKV